MFYLEPEKSIAATSGSTMRGLLCLTTVPFLALFTRRFVSRLGVWQAAFSDFDEFHSGHLAAGGLLNKLRWAAEPVQSTFPGGARECSTSGLACMGLAYSQLSIFLQI